MKRVVIIGAGPAGMMAAAVAAGDGAEVTLVEKMDRPGRKLAITGKGRCNITAAVDRDQLIKGYPDNGRFLYSAFNELSNYDLIDLLNREGLETKVERGNRVFPTCDDAHQVVEVLFKRVRRSGVKILTGTTVKSITIADRVVNGLVTDQGKLSAEAVIVCTGGMSYPGTGSTGDGYDWAAQAGHNIVEPRPGLVPLTVIEPWVADLQGLSLKNVKASAFTDAGKKINDDFGEMLFTHFGISGPIILSMSHDIGKELHKNGRLVKLKIDLKPALDEEKLDARLLSDLEKYSRKMFKNALGDLLPQKMIPVIISLSGIDPEKECHQITRAERLALDNLLKNLTLTVNGTRPIAEAIVTAGGIAVKEINPKTMESRLVKGLYFAGEIIDVDGYTGGYNLQAAFSTGYVAGKYAAQDI